jgi:hypothetical protein
MPPPPPPPDVTALAAPEDASVMTVREQLELHRADPACAGCHSLMDPIGFALEGYDAIGAWRETDQGFPIDRTGTLFDGTDFDGAMELIQVLKSNPRLPRCFAQKLLTYAIGRTEESGDECAMETLVDAWAEDGYRIRGLIVRLVLSDAFRQRAPEQEVAP